MNTGLTRLRTRAFITILFATLLISFSACSYVITDPDGDTRFAFSFEWSKEGWAGDFADYPADQDEADFALVFDWRSLPEEVGGYRKGLYLSGQNSSDDLFMFLKRQVSGLEPNQEYDVTFEVKFATNAPSGCAGIGGPPGEAVRMKAGVARSEPVPVVGEDGWWRLNVRKDENVEPPAGNTEDEGVFVELGNIANGLEQCTGDAPYRMKTLHNKRESLRYETDDDGSIWLYVGTDSGFEGTTSLYYDQIQLTFSPVE